MLVIDVPELQTAFRIVPRHFPIGWGRRRRIDLVDREGANEVVPAPWSSRFGWNS